ncbi:Hypothetical protein SMAX5B_009835 [Scophthalmus maximus]|uniref:Uncharacterized protein n=1 Tax=Scophthalmus maximus TaxID=52904 RepID=A0A2U9BZA3_SCOMX|nr:Hypothetical protein SMAX5B_009835 [Scophthalmus maximus]
MDKRITDNVDSLHSRGAGKQIAELTDRENNLMLLVCPSEEMKEKTPECQDSELVNRKRGEKTSDLWLDGDVQAV